MIVVEYDTADYIIGNSRLKMGLIIFGDWMSSFPSQGDGDKDRAYIANLKKIYLVGKRNELSKYTNVVEVSRVTTDAEVVYMKGVGSI